MNSGSYACENPSNKREDDLKLKSQANTRNEQCEEASASNSKTRNQASLILKYEKA